MGAGIAVAMSIINLALPHRLRLIGVALLLTPQLFVPGFPVSLAVLWTLMTCLAGLTLRSRPRADSPVVVIASLLTATTALSLLWALPSGIYEGLVTVVFGGVFLLWLREVIVLARDDPALLDTIVWWTVPGVALQAVLTIVFRISPVLESEFHHSWLARATIGPKIVALYGHEPNNVLESTKSGGFFVNGNVASLFGAVAALLLCVAARRTMQGWLYVFAALSFVGAAFSGSKTALIIGAGCALAVILVPRIVIGRGALAGLSILVLMPLAVSQLPGLLERAAPNFWSATDSSYALRQELWTRAAQMFKESPILGLGFGGWDERVGRLGSHVLPPHNFLIAAWANSGILAVLVATLFVVVVIAFGVRVATAQPLLYDRRTAVLALCAIVWSVLHALADNTPPYGDRQSMLLVALAIGYLYTMAPARRQKAAEFVDNTKIGSTVNRPGNAGGS